MQKVIYENARGQSITLGNTRPFILTEIGNTGNPKTTILSSKAPYQDGRSYHGSLLEERILPISGGIVGTDIEDMYSKKQYLCSIFNPKIKGELTYINNAGKHSIDVVVDSSPIFKNQVANIQKFLIQLYCPSPYWYIESIFKEVVLWKKIFHFPISKEDKNIVFGYKISNDLINIYNSGDVECGMTIYFKALAKVENPKLYNVHTQEYIQIKKILEAGDKLVINTSFGNKKVEMIKGNGKKINVFNYIDLRSTFLQLNIGDNLLKYEADDGANNLELFLSYTPLFVGV